MDEENRKYDADEGKQLGERDRDANKKHDCEIISSIESTLVTSKLRSKSLPSTTAEQIISDEERNQTQTITSQLQPSTQIEQIGTSELAPNTPPEVTDYTLNIDKDERVSIILRGSDNDGDKIIFKIIDNPKNGLINNFRTSSGSLSYSPKKDFVGDDKLLYTANDRKIDGNVGYCYYSCDG